MVLVYLTQLLFQLNTHYFIIKGPWHPIPILSQDLVVWVLIGQRDLIVLLQTDWWNTLIEYSLYSRVVAVVFCCAQSEIELDWLTLPRCELFVNETVITVHYFACNFLLSLLVTQCRSFKNLPFCLHWSWEHFWVVALKGCYINFWMNEWI